MTIPAGELDQLRTAQEDTFATTAAVMRRTETPDGAGGSTMSYPPPAVAEYPCSFSAYQITPIEREATTNVQGISFWLFRFQWDADIRGTDRLVVGTRTFEVVSASVGSMAITQSVLAQEIK